MKKTIALFILASLLVTVTHAEKTLKPTLSIERAGKSHIVKIDFDPALWILQSATNVTGPWVDAPDQKKRQSTRQEPTRFFRLKSR